MKNNLEIVPVSRVGEVLEHALLRKLEPIEWTEPATPVSTAPAEDEAGVSTAH